MKRNFGKGFDEGQRRVKWIVWILIGGFVVWFLFEGFNLVEDFIGFSY